jgi:transcriptional regulator with XRE-family HTH domain
MDKSLAPSPQLAFTTFGDLLKYLRRRERLTQLEVPVKVGYSKAQISCLEKNQRLPERNALKWKARASCDWTA